MNAQEVFKRYEKKYRLSDRQFCLLLPILYKHMEMDQYGQHTIYNLYMDTPDYQLIRTSIEKPTYKEKLRIRSYGPADKDHTVFLELKKKYAGIVYKRRLSLTYEELLYYLQSGQMPKDVNPQIMKEIDFSIRRYQAEPKVFLSYERFALFGKDDSNLRVTFDRNITCRTTDLRLQDALYGDQILNEDEHLMEVKIPGTMPLWMASALSELEIFPTSFSKYGTYYSHYICQPVPVTSKTDYEIIHEKGGVYCA